MDKNTILKLRKLCNGLKVLYVEDDESIALQLERILKKIFNNIDVKTNGKEGLQKYKEQQHDIVITDILMPKMNGIEMSYHIKKLNKNQVIIITSAHSEMKYMSKLIDIGVNKFVLKPIDLEVFLELLAKIAMKIFKNRKEDVLENEKMQTNVFAGINNPVAIVEDNKLKYVNDIFKKNFLKESDGDIKDFKLSYIFKDEQMHSLSNTDILKKIVGMKKVYEVLHIDSQLYKTYKIDVIKSDEQNKYLLNFINIDFVINDLEKSSIHNSTKFKTRKDFLKNLHQVCNDDKKYHIFCFGLKNLQKYVKEYGAKQMSSINNKVAMDIKKEFSMMIDQRDVYIYFFATNRYILIAKENENENIYDKVINKLKRFGNNYKWESGSSIGFHLDYISENLNKEMLKKEIIDNTDAMLYMLKD